MYRNLTGGRKIKYMIYIDRDSGNNLFCCIRILDTYFLTFTVFLSKDASNYLNGGKGYMALVLDDNSLFEA